MYTFFGRIAHNTVDTISSDCESPSSNPTRLVVHADVHHELNWSPTKCQASETVCVPSPKTMNNSEVIERESQLHAEHISLNNGDSGVICDEIATLSSISEHSTMPSIEEIPSRLLISSGSAVVSDFSECNQNNP